ncbi:MAG: 4Fe-4S binding protein [Dethiobacter sp.]|jgi:ferredoxin|nr:4Fe-4S binding protein [Dethiobacter sp.]
MKRKLVLRFPGTVVEFPFMYTLVKEFNVMPNILKANINPRKEGQMVVELTADEKDLSEAVEFMQSRGVIVLPLEQQIVWVEERCNQCGACTVICPSGALTMKRPEMTVTFEGDKCIVCEHCLKACPARAVEARYLSGE